MKEAIKHSLFSLTIVSSSGEVRQLRSEAATRQHAIEMAERDGHSVVHCALLSETWHERLLRSVHSLHLGTTGANIGGSSKFDTVSFSQDMSTLLEAGVSVKESVRVLQRKETSEYRKGLLKQIDLSIEKGLPLSVALEKTGVVPELLVATISASEETGDLAVGLSRYAKFQQSLKGVKDKVIGACVYPLMLLSVGFLVVMLLLGVVVPKFATLIDSNAKDLPTLSKALMAWGGFAEKHPAAIGILIGALIFGALFFAKKMMDPQAQKRVISRIPGVEKVLREFQHLQMYRTTAILTSRGISIHKALPFSMEFLNKQDQKNLEAALVAMSQGESVGSAMSKSGVSDIVATSMLSVAEKTGSMPEILDRIADFYEKNLQKNIDIVSRMIEPALMIIFGTVIGGIVVLMYLPIFDLASSIS